jgi:hypothetical protein
MTTFGQSWFCEKMGKWNLVRSWNWEGKPFVFCACVCHKMTNKQYNFLEWEGVPWIGGLLFDNWIYSFTIIGLHLEEACSKDLAIKVMNMGFYKCVRIWVKFYKIITKWAAIAIYWARYYLGFSFAFYACDNENLLPKNCCTKDRGYLDTCFTIFNRSFHYISWNLSWLLRNIKGNICSFQ